MIIVICFTIQYMAFDIRVSSPTWHTPVHYFPGDETIDIETYSSAIFSGYVSSVSTLYGAARGFGLDIDSESFERWKRLGAASGLLDDFLDESGDILGASVLYEDGLTRAVAGDEDITAPSWTDTRLPAAVRLLQHCVHALPENQNQALLQAAYGIGRIAVAKAECTDVHEYISHLEAEGRRTAVLISASTSEYVRRQDGYAEFEKWCASTLICATFADSARDIWKDTAAGRVGVEPTVLNSFRILFSIRHHSRGLYATPAAARASVAGMIARARFSLLPTKAAMSR